MELEVTPEPTPEERRAIELALAPAGDDGQSGWAASLGGRTAPQEPGREPRVVES